MRLDSNEKGIQSGLSSLGFIYHPFERLEASNDKFLPEYLIGHDMFSVAWALAPAALFARAGGGKTAMRIYTLRTCWLSHQKKKFPISYDVPLYFQSGNSISLIDHQRALAAATATDVLLACAYRPKLYLELSPSRRIALLSLVQQALPANLEWALNLLDETRNPERLSVHLDRTYAIPEPPSPSVVKEFCRTVQNDFSQLTLGEMSPGAIFDQLLAGIIQDLGFESVLILLDGVDGVSATANNAKAQFELIEPLFQQALHWPKRHVFLKVFLPLELERAVVSHAKTFYKRSSHAAIVWDVENLAEILRRRVRVASQGKFSSLNAISSRAVRDLEMLIAERALPLPRECLVLAGYVLDNYLTRCGGIGELELDDIAHAEEQYQKGMRDGEALRSQNKVEER